MKVKVNEASGPVLDWMVAKCEEANVGEGYYTGIVLRDGEVKYAPSTDWAQGGPIIERECISVVIAGNGYCMATMSYQNEDEDKDMDCEEHGPTPLVAAMRCFVVSRLGEEVEVPDELTP